MKDILKDVLKTLAKQKASKKAEGKIWRKNRPFVEALAAHIKSIFYLGFIKCNVVFQNYAESC